MGFSEFWWVSALSAFDTRDAQAHVFTRNVHHRLASGVPPEEVTTFNLVRRLTHRWAAAGGRSVSLHSRWLEGRSSAGGGPPSGIDLELAVQVGPSTWYDLVLQAKRFNTPTGNYRGWNPTQNRRMARWAASHGQRTPAMLLYNTMTQPFPGNGQDTDLFGACCTQPKRRHGWSWPGPKASPFTLPDDRSPLAISIVSDPAMLSGLTDPTPKQVAAGAYPWECLFCPVVHVGSAALMPPKDDVPIWAGELLEEAAQIAPDGDDPRPPSDADDNTADDDHPELSVVLALDPDQI